MRTIPFREVLWGVAYKLGLDPAKDLLSEQAAALTSSINAWVRRLYDSADFPEWTGIDQRTPDANHVVSYEIGQQEAAPPGSHSPIDRVFKVYLNDPLVTPGPLEIPHRLLQQGIHCGFEHGTNVWIKTIGLAPQFTSRPWDVGATYYRGELVYSPVTGECYVSNSGGNQGHDPTGQQGVQPPPLTVALVQTAVPETPAIAGRTQITKITQVVDPILTTSQTQHTWDILDETGAVIGSATYAAIPADTPADILTAIYNSLDANPALAAFTFTLDTTALTIQIEANQFFAVRSYYFSYTTPATEPVTTGAAPTPDELVTGDDLATVTIGAPYPWPPTYTVNNTINNLQYYVQAVAYVAPKPQIIELSMSAQSAVAGASYDLTFVDTVGPSHAIHYLNDPARSSAGILQGIMEEIEASTDPFFQAMSLILDAPLLKLTFAAYDMVSLNAVVSPVGNAWWTPRLFPLALADPVIEGAYSEALKDEGQTDKAQAEAQIAGGYAVESQVKQVSQPYDVLTDQQQPRSRYRIDLATGGGAK